MGRESIDDAVARLAPGFSGELIRPGGAGYDESRRVHNGLIDKRPALIARCRNVGDIVDAVNLARQLDLEIAVRGGGHNVAGRATVDGGLMVDLAPMKGIHVDPVTRTGRAQGGATWKEFNRETQIHGLATTGGMVGSTGISGLTLGGGLGWLMPKYGMALDNLLSVQLVTADGRVVQASAQENPDLFWAVRGGGGNFGVAASLEFRLHPVGPMVTGGLVAHPVEKARDVLRFFRECAAAASDETMLVGALVPAPDGSGAKLAAIAACHCGTPAEGAAALAPIKAFGRPAMDAMGPIPYVALNGMLDGGFPKGALNYWKSNFVPALSDAALMVAIESFLGCPAPMGQILFEHFHGAATRVGVSETAYALRSTGFNALILSQWLEAKDTERSIAWARQTYSALEPFFGPTRYLNYLGDDEPGDPVQQAYGANYERLRKLKRRYDPENVFHLNQNIRPA
jgi:FAD/FMN-containing dehydrogenase